MNLSSVCVYCGSSNRVDDAYYQIATRVGQTLAQNKLTLVYGGGHVGLMGAVADATLSGGGKVVGIIPEHIRTKELQHNGLTELHVVENMHVRKSMMVEKADAFVILPGGFGTMDEFFEVMTWKQLGLHDKPIVVFNINGFWDPLLQLINHMIDSHFAPENNREIYKVVTSVEEMMAALSSGEHFKANLQEKWQ